MAEVENRISHATEEVNQEKTTVIFYDLEVSKDGQVEQLSAFADGGENFGVH